MEFILPKLSKKQKSQLLRSEKVLEILSGKESKFTTAKWICDLLDDYNDSKLEYSERLEAIQDLNLLLKYLLEDLDRSKFIIDLFPGIISMILKVVNSNCGKIVLRKEGLDALCQIFKTKHYSGKILQIFKIFLTKLSKDYSEQIRKSYAELLISLTDDSEYLHDYILDGLLELSLDDYSEISQIAKLGLKNGILKEKISLKFKTEIQNLKFDKDNCKILKVLTGILTEFDGKLQDFDYGFSKEYLENLFQGLEIKDFSKIHVQEISMQEAFHKIPLDSLESVDIDSIIKFQNLEAKDLSLFFQLWSQNMSSSQLQRFLINLIPFTNPQSDLCYQPMALFILGCVFRGLKKRPSVDKDTVRFLKKLFKDIIGFQISNLPITKNQQNLKLKLQESSPWNHLADFYSLQASKVEHKRQILLSKDDYQRNALISCLFLSILSDLSSVLQSQFEPFLIDGLYPILEKLGNSNGVVSLSAWKALSEISENMACKGSQSEDQIKDLLINNVDYIINHVSRNLREFQCHPYAPNVLAATIRIVGLKILDFLDDSILELLDLLGEYHNVNENVIQVILNVFHALADVIAQDKIKEDVFRVKDSRIDLKHKFGNASVEMIAYYVKNYSDKSKEESSDNEHPKSAEEFFLTKQKEKEETQSEGEEELSDQVVSSSEAEDISKICKFSGLILPKLVHFLTVESPHLRKYVIELLGKMVPFLKEREPFIHSVWSSLVSRLNDHQYYIIQEALRVISIISNLSPEFVSKRIADDVIPRAIIVFTQLDHDLREFVESKSNITTVSSRFSHHNYTKKLKIMSSILDHIQNLLKSISVNFKDTKNLTESLIPLLHLEYPVEITGSAMSMLRNLLQKDHGDVVYLSLWTHCGATALCSLNTSFKSLSIPPSRVENSDRFVFNCSSVLDCPLSPDWSEKGITNGIWKR